MEGLYLIFSHLVLHLMVPLRLCSYTAMQRDTILCSAHDSTDHIAFVQSNV